MMPAVGRADNTVSTTSELQTAAKSYPTSPTCTWRANPQHPTVRSHEDLTCTQKRGPILKEFHLVGGFNPSEKY